MVFICYLFVVLFLVLLSWWCSTQLQTREAVSARQSFTVAKTLGRRWGWGCPPAPHLGVTIMWPGTSCREDEASQGY